MKPEIIAVTVIFFAFCFAEFLRTDLFHKARQRRKDGIVEFLSTTILLIVTQPLVLLAGGLLAATRESGRELLPRDGRFQ